MRTVRLNGVRAAFAALCYIAAAVTWLIASAVSAESATGSGSSAVRLVHIGRADVTVDVAVDGQPVLRGIPGRSIAPYVKLEAGWHEIQIATSRGGVEQTIYESVTAKRAYDLVINSLLDPQDQAAVTFVPEPIDSRGMRVIDVRRRESSPIQVTGLSPAGDTSTKPPYVLGFDRPTGSFGIVVDGVEHSLTLGPTRVAGQDLVIIVDDDERKTQVNVMASTLAPPLSRLSGNESLPGELALRDRADSAGRPANHLVIFSIVPIIVGGAAVTVRRRRRMLGRRAAWLQASTRSR